MSETIDRGKPVNPGNDYEVLLAEGTALVSEVLPHGEPGPYQLQAAIAAVHDEAATMADTDWPQILALYNLLEHLAPNPFTTLNRAVALAMEIGRAHV